MHQALSWLLAIAAVALFLGTLQRARLARGGGSRKAAGPRRAGFLAHRRELRRIREKGRQDRLRDEAKHRHRLAEGEHRIREQAARAASGAGRAASGAAEGVRRVIRLKPEKPGDGDEPQDAPPPRNRPGGPEDPPGAPRQPPRQPPPGPEPPAPPPAPPRPSPPPQSPPAPAPAPANGGTATVTSPAVVGGIEDLITAIDRIRARAAAGNAKAKLAALRACSAACLRFAQMAMTLARQMAEQGHYGPEITERASAAGIHLTAAASAFSDSANGVATLLNMRLVDMPESGRQAPHHAELSETGAR